jgi:hypothetical protein
VFDLKVLEAVAKQTFEQVARQTIKGSFKTRELYARKLLAQGSGVAVVESDLLSIFPGDSVLALVAPAAQIAQSLQTSVYQARNSFQELAAAGVAKRTQEFVKLGISRATAEQIAAAQELVENANKFQVHGVSVNFDHDNGVDVNVEIQNFITVRDEEAQGIRSAARSAATRRVL